MALVLVERGVAGLLVVRALKLAHGDIHAVPLHHVVNQSRLKEVQRQGQWCKGRGKGADVRSGAGLRAAVEEAAVGAADAQSHVTAG